MAQFHAFRDERPKEERWELIDGVPMMMPPPTLIHQRIALNLIWLLKSRLELVKPEWCVSQESGLLLDGDDKYNPEPDVVVIDTKIEIAQIYADRFYAVAEVLSPNDKPEVLAAKLSYYQAHEHNRSVLLVRQDQIGAIRHARNDAGDWRQQELSAATDSISLPVIGHVGHLGELYANTPLDPSRIR